jgi:hypothetical protein
MYVYNISGDVANIFYQSCALIDNNQQVYEAQIQMPRCKKGIIKVEDGFMLTWCNFIFDGVLFNVDTYRRT